MNISRRSFLFGGTASIIGAGAVLSGCNHKIGDKQTGNTDSIKVAVVDYFDKFEYAGTTNPTIAAIGWHIFEGLYDISPRTNETYPALAKGKPQKIDDLTYEVELRDNAKFSNDAVLMAGDVVYSFSAAKQKPTINYMLDFIKEVQAAGSNKVRFILNYAVNGVFEERLSLVKIQPAVGSDVDKQKAPVGTGPYMITEMEGSIGGEIKFVPNSNYNGNLEKPKNSMIWTINPDGEARAGAMKGGAAAIGEDMPVDKVFELRDSNVDVDFIEGFENAFFFFNETKSTFKNKAARQAVFYAVDTQRIIDEKMGGHAQPAKCFLAESNKNYHQASTVYNYNPEKAKELLGKSGLTNPSVNLVFDKNCFAYKFKDIVVENLEAVGFTCNIKETEFRWTDLDEKLKGLEYDLCLSTIERSLHGANADFLLNYIYIQGAYMHARTGYASAEGNRFDEITNLTKQAASATGSEQQKLYNQVFDIIAEDVPMYPIIHREQITGSDSGKVRGFQPISTGGIYIIGSELN